MHLQAICVDNNFACIVLEPAEKGSLYDNIMDTEKFNLVQRGKIALDLIEGLIYLHQQGIIHRGLESKNVVINAKKQAKLKILLNRK